jgi:hypothetical protein
MRCLIVVLVLALAACGGDSPIAPAPLREPLPSLPADPLLAETWIISGQSNAVGCAVGSGPNPTSSVLMPRFGEWVPARDPLPFMEPYPGCEVGPWVTAAQAYAAQTGRTVHLTGWGRVASPITLWGPTAEGWIRLRMMIDYDGQRASTLLWWQGETEATLDRTTGYAAALTDLVRRTREATRNPMLRVLVIGLADAPYASQLTGYDRLRAEQRAYAAADGNAVIVSAEGLPLNPEGPYHLTAEGYAALGRRVATALAAE